MLLKFRTEYLETYFHSVKSLTTCHFYDIESRAPNDRKAKMAPNTAHGNLLNVISAKQIKLYTIISTESACSTEHWHGHEMDLVPHDLEDASFAGHSVFTATAQ